jgi:hypothetical protein
MIFWRSKKQQTISRSFSKGEYRSMAVVSCELTWLFSLLDDLQVVYHKPALLFCDSQETLHIATNPISMNAPSTSRLIAICFVRKFS